MPDAVASLDHLADRLVAENRRVIATVKGALDDVAVGPTKATGKSPDAHLMRARIGHRDVAQIDTARLADDNGLHAAMALGAGASRR